MNRPKPARTSRPAKPEFGLGLVAVGLGVGLLAGAVVEVVTGTGMVVMQAGGFSGILAGAVVESLGYWHRQRVYRSNRKT